MISLQCDVYGILRVPHAATIAQQNRLDSSENGNCCGQGEAWRTPFDESSPSKADGIHHGIHKAVKCCRLSRSALDTIPAWFRGICTKPVLSTGRRDDHPDHHPSRLGHGAVK